MHSNYYHTIPVCDRHHAYINKFNTKHVGLGHDLNKFICNEIIAVKGVS